MRYFLLKQRRNSETINEDYYLGFYSEGSAKTFQKSEESEMQKKFKKVYGERCNGDFEKYAKTVAMYKAFVAIALDKINFQGKNSDDRTCEVFRGMAHETLCQADYSYIQRKTGDKIVMRHHIAESTSIEGSLGFFSGGGMDVHKFHVPFAQVVAPYFLHLNLSDFFGKECELVCNLNGLEAEIFSQM
ncbi:MAG: hypothetical protein LBB05_03640 [Puniceicoccales bacterium]|jgi:hypothetical protein|nr:hypothetical protein [Puniceicoccales bacterium]